MINTQAGTRKLLTGITFILLFVASTLHAQLVPVEKVSTDFITLLQRPSVAPNPSFQTFATDSVITEKGFFFSEATEKVPVLIYKPVGGDTKKLPVVICLHGTGGRADGMKNLL